MLIALLVATGVIGGQKQQDPVRGGKFVRVEDFSALKNLVQPVEWQDRKPEEQKKPAEIEKSKPDITIYRATAADAQTLRSMLRQLPKTESARPQILVVGTDPSDEEEAAIIQLIADLL